MRFGDHFYDEYNSFVLKRVYGEKKIREVFGRIPEGAKRIQLPSLVERVTGELYVVNEANRQSILGNDFRALIIEMLVEGRRAAVRAAYMQNTLH